jgi:hypothetical protein
MNGSRIPPVPLCAIVRQVSGTGPYCTIFASIFEERRCRMVMEFYRILKCSRMHVFTPPLALALIARNDHDSVADNVASQSVKCGTIIFPTDRDHPDPIRATL